MQNKVKVVTGRQSGFHLLTMHSFSVSNSDYCKKEINRFKDV